MKIAEFTKPFKLKLVSQYSIGKRGYSKSFWYDLFGVWIQISKPIIKFSRILMPLQRSHEHSYDFVNEKKKKNL